MEHREAMDVLSYANDIYRRGMHLNGQAAQRAAEAQNRLTAEWLRPLFEFMADHGGSCGWRTVPGE